MSKYRNKKVITEEGVFDSKAEYARWRELKILERAGEIHSLVRQKPIEFFLEKKKIFTYKADACYYSKEHKALVVEDVKGSKKIETAVFRLKWKLLKARYPNWIFLVHYSK
jgi:hypothetical protein